MALRSGLVGLFIEAPVGAVAAPASCPGCSHLAGLRGRLGAGRWAPVALAALSMLGLTLREGDGDGQRADDFGECVRARDSI